MRCCATKAPKKGLQKESLINTIRPSPRSFMRVTSMFAAPLLGRRFCTQPQNHNAFTLNELLVAIAIIAIRASLLMPAMGAAKGKAQTSSCLNNFKQLQTAWLIYTIDYGDALPANKCMSVDWEDGCPSGTQTTSDSWVMGDATADLDIGTYRTGACFPIQRPPRSITARRTGRASITGRRLFESAAIP